MEKASIKTTRLARSRFLLGPLMAATAVLLWASCGGGGPQLPAGVINCDPLSESERYRFEIHGVVDLKEFDGPKTEDDQYPGEGFRLDQVVTGATDVGDLDVVIAYPELDDSEVHIISVGNLYWTLVEADWVAHQATPETPLPVPYVPLSLCQGIATNLNLEGVEGVPESVGEIKARRYQLDPFPTSLAASIWTAESDMGRLITEYSGDIWIAEKGTFPVQMELVGTGLYTSGRELVTEISMEIADYGSSDIKVEAPPE